MGYFAIELKKVGLNISAAFGEKADRNEEQYASIQVLIIHVEIAILWIQATPGANFR